MEIFEVKKCETRVEETENGRESTFAIDMKGRRRPDKFNRALAFSAFLSSLYIP